MPSLVTSASCGSRGWTGTDCLCPAGQVAQEGGRCVTFAAPVSCPAPYEALITTTVFPQGICVPSDVNFNDPNNAYLGRLLSVLSGHLNLGATDPLARITSVYGPLVPGVTGVAPVMLAQRVAPLIQTPLAPSPTVPDIVGDSQNRVTMPLQAGTLPAGMSIAQATGTPAVMGGPGPGDAGPVVAPPPARVQAPKFPLVKVALLALVVILVAKNL